MNIDEIRNINVTSIHFSKRTMNALKNENIETLGQIMDVSDSYLIRMPNFGRRSLNEIREYISNLLGIENFEEEKEKFINSCINEKQFIKWCLKNKQILNRLRIGIK